MSIISRLNSETKTFNVSMDFTRMIEYALDPESMISKRIQSDYINKNYQNVYIRSLMSIDFVGLPKIRPCYINTFTVDVTFTAQVIRLESGMVLYDPVTFSLKNDANNLFGKVPLEDSPGGIIITYNKMYRDLHVGFIFPTVISEVRHCVHNKDIFVTGEVLLPYMAEPYYVHDGSSGPSGIFGGIKRIDFAEETRDLAKTVYSKLRPAFDGPWTKGKSVVSGTSFSKKVYSLAGPLGPILECPEKSETDADVKVVNMHDIVKKMEDCNNAIIHISNLYSTGQDMANKMKIYVILLNQAMKRAQEGFKAGQ